MKKLFITLLATAAIASAHAQENKPAAPAPVPAKFNMETIQMGKVPQGVPAPATFTVTNTGKTPLVIEWAKPGCGCTMSEYTKTPIKPHKTGTITATYNAAAAGNFNKSISVKFVGSDEVKTLFITGEVVAKDAEKKEAAAK